MFDVPSATLRAFYLFDVADSIDLGRLRTIEGEGLAPADIALRQHSSNAYLQFPLPPLVARLPDVRFGEALAQVRVKLFDYGVIALLFSFPAAGAWDDVRALADRVRRDEAIAREARTIVDRICSELREALDDPHEPLVEDSYTLEVERFATQISGADLLAGHAAALAGFLLAESAELAPTEIDESLRVRFSYNVDDLTIVQWDTAFIYDRGESADAIGDILEFANSQLLELRTYDALLDRELDDIYKLQPGGSATSISGRREADLAASLRYLIVDVLELLDRSSNALKVVGDAYYARIYRAAAGRLGLADWQKQIDTKLASVGDMYRFLTDQSRSRRDEFLEVVVIVLIALELIVGVATLMRH